MKFYRGKFQDWIEHHAKNYIFNFYHLPLSDVTYTFKGRIVEVLDTPNGILLGIQYIEMEDGEIIEESDIIEYEWLHEMGFTRNVG